jgi:hypothetical protein
MADLSRIIQAAAQAALDDSSQSPMQQVSQKAKNKGMSTPRALLIGAGLFTAGRVLVRNRSAGLVEALQRRLDEFEGEHGESEDAYEEDEEFAEEPEAEYDEEEEPEGEYDEEEEPEGEYDEEEEPEGESEVDDEEDERPRKRSRSRAAAGGKRR